MFVNPFSDLLVLKKLVSGRNLLLAKIVIYAVQSTFDHRQGKKVHIK